VGSKFTNGNVWIVKPFFKTQVGSCSGKKGVSGKFFFFRERRQRRLICSFGLNLEVKDQADDAGISSSPDDSGEAALNFPLK